MKHFEKVASGLDVAPALAEIWKLRVGAINFPFDGDPDPALTLPLYQHPAMSGLGYQSEAYTSVHALLSSAVELLGDVVLYEAGIRILRPGDRVPKHRDSDFMWKGRTRYHLALQHDPGAKFVIAKETCRYKAGEMWRVDIANRPHYAVNASERSRVIAMIDVCDSALFDPAEARRHYDEYKARHDAAYGHAGYWRDEPQSQRAD